MIIEYQFANKKYLKVENIILCAHPKHFPHCRKFETQPSRDLSISYSTYLIVIVAVNGAGNLLNVQAAGRCVDDVLVDAAFLIDLVRVARLLDAAILKSVNDVGIDDLRDAVRNDDDGAVLLDGIDAVLDLFGRDGIK